MAPGADYTSRRAGTSPARTTLPGVPPPPAPARTTPPGVPPPPPPARPGARAGSAGVCSLRGLAPRGAGPVFRQPVGVRAWAGDRGRWAAAEPGRTVAKAPGGEEGPRLAV